MSHDDLRGSTARKNRATAYQRALAHLRDLHRDEFEQLYTLQINELTDQIASDLRGRMSLFRSKPTTIEAVHWTGDEASLRAVRRAFGSKASYDHDRLGLLILAGVDGAQEWVPVPVGHWIIRQPDDNSDIWPVEHAYFEAKYEPAEPSPNARPTPSAEPSPTAAQES